MRSLIYDFETLGQDPEENVVLSLATLEFDESKFLTDDRKDIAVYEDYLGQTNYIKFDVREQIEKYNRRVNPDTLEWWRNQGAEAQLVLKPRKDDSSISELHNWLITNHGNPSEIDRVWTRGNTFDPIFLPWTLKVCGKSDPFPWWAIRDTRSYLDALIEGAEVDMNNKFMPSKAIKERFVHHDARHDIVLDVMRLRTLKRSILK